jgi:hypothetical protein
MPVPLLGFALQSIVPPVQATAVSDAVTLLALGAHADVSTVRLEPDTTT